MNQTIVFFGDSICEGYRAAPGEGWVERLAKKLPHLAVVNSGVSGETTKDALRRFDASVTVHKPDMVYVQFGLNDASWWCRQVGTPWLTEDQYIANMREIVARCAQSGVRRVLVATNHPVNVGASCADDELRAPTDYATMVTQYNAALRRAFAHNEGVLLVDIEAAIRAQEQPHTDFLNPDGVHLSARGNAFYAETVSALLEQ